MTVTVVDVKTGEVTQRPLTPEEVAYIGSIQASVPESITPLQGLRAIDAAGLSEDYLKWANSQDRSFLERAFIDKAQTWQRDDPVLVAGASAIGLTDEQLDQLFITASQL